MPVPSPTLNPLSSSPEGFAPLAQRLWGCSRGNFLGVVQVGGQKLGGAAGAHRTLVLGGSFVCLFVFFFCDSLGVWAPARAPGGGGDFRGRARPGPRYCPSCPGLGAGGAAGLRGDGVGGGAAARLGLTAPRQ